MTITRQEVEAIATKRGYKLPHRTIENCIKDNDYFEMLSKEEIDIVSSERNGLSTSDFLKLSRDEKDAIRNNKIIELLKK